MITRSRMAGCHGGATARGLMERESVVRGRGAMARRGGVSLSGRTPKARLGAVVAGGAALLAARPSRADQFSCSAAESDYELSLSTEMAVGLGVGLLVALGVGGWALHRRGFNRGVALGVRRGKPRGYHEGFAAGVAAGRREGRLEPRTTTERAYALADQLVGRGQHAQARLIIDGAISAARRAVDLVAEVQGLSRRARIETYLAEFQNAETTYRTAMEVLSRRHDEVAAANEPEQAYACRRNLGRLLLEIAYVKLYRGKPTQVSLDKEFITTLEQARAMFVENDDAEGLAATYVAQTLRQISWHRGVAAEGPLLAALRRLETYPRGSVDLDPDATFAKLHAEIEAALAESEQAEVKPDLGPKLFAALEAQLMRGAIDHGASIAEQLAENYQRLGVDHLAREARAWSEGLSRIAPQVERMQAAEQRKQLDDDEESPTWATRPRRDRVTPPFLPAVRDK